MCWNTHREKYKQPHVAKRDIKVLKAVNLIDNELKPYHHPDEITYELGKNIPQNLALRKVR